MKCSVHPDTTAWYYWHPPTTNIWALLCLACSSTLTDDGLSEEMSTIPYRADAWQPRDPGEGGPK